MSQNTYTHLTHINTYKQLKVGPQYWKLLSKPGIPVLKVAEWLLNIFIYNPFTINQLFLYIPWYFIFVSCLRTWKNWKIILKFWNRDTLFILKFRQLNFEIETGEHWNFDSWTLKSRQWNNTRFFLYKQHKILSEAQSCLSFSLL